MRIAIACDHAGFPLKQTVIDEVLSEGHDVIDLGTDSPVPVDFPDFTEKLGRSIQNGQAERGILVCGSGVGACIAANKMIGIYACLCHDTYSAHQGVEHDDMNVLCLGGRIVGPELAKELVRAFMGAHYLAADPYQRRVNKLLRIERENRAVG